MGEKKKEGTKKKKARMTRNKNNNMNNNAPLDSFVFVSLSKTRPIRYKHPTPHIRMKLFRSLEVNIPIDPKI